MRLSTPLSSLATGLAVALAGCAHHAGTDAPIDLPLSSIKTIAIVPATTPRAYTLLNVNGASVLVPLLQTVTYIDSRKKAAAFNAKIQPQRSSMAADLTRCVDSALAGYGYKVEVLSDVTRPADDPDDVDLEKIRTPADAVLQLTFTEVGVFSSLSSNLYLPRVNAHGTLYVKGRRRHTPYDENVKYGVDAKAGNDGEIVADPRFAYANFDALMADTDEVQKVFDIGAGKICETMSAGLKEVLDRTEE